MQQARPAVAKKRTSVNSQLRSSKDLLKQGKPDDAVLPALSALNMALSKGSLKPVYFENAMKVLVRARLYKLAEIVGSHTANAGISTPKLCLRMAQAMIKHNQREVAAKWIDHGLTLNPTVAEKTMLTKLRDNLVKPKKAFSR